MSALVSAKKGRKGTLAPKIRELADEGEMSATEIADSLGTSAAYVRTVLSRKKRGIGKAGGPVAEVAESAILGSEMAALREIIREVSTSKRVDAVVRAFGMRDSTDYIGLAKLINRARIPVADSAFIIENWSTHIGDSLDEQEISDIIAKSHTSTVKKIREAEKSSTPQTLDDMNKEQAKHMEQRIGYLRQRQLLRDLEQDLGESGQTGQNPMIVKRRRKVPKMNPDGSMQTNEQGEPVIEDIEEEMPYTPYIQQPAGNDMLPLLMNQMNQQNTASQNTLMTLITAMLERKDTPPADTDKELLIKLLETQGDSKLDQLRNDYVRQVDELKQAMKEKDIQDQFGGYISELQDEIKNMKGAGMSDERFRLQMQTDLTKRLLDEVSVAKESVGGALGTLAKEMAEDRRHLRHLEQLRAARDLGYDPRDLKRSWESERVPDVTEDDMEMIMAGH